MLDPGLGVETSPPHDAVAGPAGPADHVHVVHRALGHGIPDLIGAPGIVAGHGQIEAVLVGEPRGGIHAVAHREHHRVARDHARLAGADGVDPVALPLEPRLLDLQARHAAALRHHPPGRGEEAEGQARAGARLRLGALAQRAQELVGILAGGLQTRSDAGDLRAVEVAVEGVLDVLELAVVVRLLEGAAARDRDHRVAVAEVDAVVRDVHHDVAHPHDGHAAAHGVGLLAEGRQAVVVVDEILGVVDAREPLALDAQVLGALRADREHERVEAELAQLADGEGPAVRHRHVPEIGDPRIGENFLELPPQPRLHLVLVEEDAVLGEPARLDVTIEQEDAATLGRERPGGEEPRRAGADHGDDVSHRVPSRCVRHATSHPIGLRCAIRHHSTGATRGPARALDHFGRRGV